MCLPKCIYALIRITKKEKIKSIFKSLDKQAAVLCRSAGVQITEDSGCSLLDIQKFQTYLRDYEIIVYDDMKDVSKIIYKGKPFVHDCKKLYLYYSHEQKHYYGIKSITAFFNKPYSCNFCDTVFNKKNFHKCPFKCVYCRSSPPCPTVQTMSLCTDCNRSFKGEECFRQHKEKKAVEKPSVCEVLQVCKFCSNVIDALQRKGVPHTCDEIYCPICCEIKPGDHLCYMKPSKRKVSNKNLFIFFDCECTQNKPYQNKPEDFLHEVNLIVAQHCCFSCINDEDITNSCSVCGDRQSVFLQDKENKDVVKDFLDYCLYHRPYVNNVYIIAHNMQGYDGHFLLADLVKRNLDGNGKNF